MVGDDIRTLTSKNTKWYQKAGAAISIASNFIPGGGVASKAAKAAIKGTSKSVKASKASKTVTKATKKVKTTSKKIKVNKKPKTVAASSIKRTTKTNSPAPLKVTKTTPKPKAKASPPPKKKRGETKTRIEKSESKKAVAKGTTVKNTTVKNTTVKVKDVTKEPFVPDEYWKKKAPQNATPGSKIIHYREYKGKIEKSTVIYDDFGRQKYRIDHADHSMPNDHSVPHLHEYKYGPGYDPEKGMEFVYNFWR